MISDRKANIPGYLASRNKMPLANTFMISFARTVASIVVVLTLNSVAATQGTECPQPSSIVFDEFDFTTTEDMKQRFARFEQKIRELETAKGVVAIFAGAQARIDSVSFLLKKAARMSEFAKEDYRADIWLRFAGYRERESYSLMIRPMECSSYNLPMADLSVDRVKFEGFEDDSTVRLDRTELMRAVIDPTPVKCPPAARAVRACSNETSAEVFVLISAKGSVVFSTAINAHPLLRAAAGAGVRKWTFGPHLVDGNSMKRAGIVIISFEEGPGISSNE
jgi:hypothetical protein